MCPTLSDELDEHLSFTTETPAQIRKRVVVSLAVMLPGAAWAIWLAYKGGGLTDRELEIHSWLTTYLVLEGVGLISCCFISLRGAWFVDAKGITFVPCHGGARSLAWSSVERVCWEDLGAELRGVGVAIRLFWPALDRFDRDVARACVEKWLAKDFDLAPRPAPTPPPKPQPPQRPRVRLLRRILDYTLALTIALAIGGIYMSFMFLTALSDPNGATLRWLGLSPVIVLVPGMLLLIWEDLYKNWRKPRPKPTPWRERRCFSVN